MKNIQRRVICLLLFLSATCLVAGYCLVQTNAPVLGEFVWRQGIFFIVLAFVYRVVVRIHKE